SCSSSGFERVSNSGRSGQVFGKSIIKLIGLVFAGAIALAGGAELLASVVGVVLAFRASNPFPLILVITVTMVLLRIVKSQKEETPVKMILNIVAYAATGYLIVVGFVIALPYGLMASIATAIATSIVVSVIGDPASISTQIKNYIPFTLGNSFQGVSRKVVQTSDGSSFLVNSSSTIIIIKPQDRHKVVELMRDRSLLPISLTHFEDIDVLFISKMENRALFNHVNSLLSSYDIQPESKAPALLSEAIQMIPIIDEQNGFPMKEYRLARDKKTVQDLLTNWPPRMTVFPSEKGLMVLVPYSEVVGLNVETLKRGYESEILLHRDFTSILEAGESVESAA
ncbi:MAG: hypothetical protein ACFFFK_08285, partial [Candidatus Thorarchaeota archaeon]